MLFWVFQLIRHNFSFVNSHFEVFNWNMPTSNRFQSKTIKCFGNLCILKGLQRDILFKVVIMRTSDVQTSSRFDTIWTKTSKREKLRTLSAQLKNKKYLIMYYKKIKLEKINRKDLAWFLFSWHWYYPDLFNTYNIFLLCVIMLLRCCLLIFFSVFFSLSEFCSCFEPYQAGCSSCSLSVVSS